MATETQLSGAQCINIVAAVQAGMSQAEVAAALALPEATVAALWAQCEQQGLMEWCIAQRVGSPATFARPLLPVDYAALPQFLIAAVSAVLSQRLDAGAAAAIFNVSPTKLSAALVQAQALGLDSWSAQVAATPSEPVSYRLTHFSGAHKIAMVAALLSGTKTFEQISADQCVPVRSLRAQLQRAQKMGLCAWCQEMRAHDHKRRRSAQMLAFETAHPLPEPDFAAIPAFKHDALRALMHHELSVEQIAAALTLAPETISAWAQELAPLHPESQDTLSYSGTRRITMLAQFLSGKYGNLTRTATYLHVGRSTLERFLKEAQEQGLFAWCAALRAADRAIAEGIADIILIGNPSEINAMAADWNLMNIGGATIIDPNDNPKAEEYAQLLAELRKKKGMTIEEARELVKNPLYLGCLMIKNGDADGQVAGARNTTGNVLRPALQIIKTSPGITCVSGAMLLLTQTQEYGEDGVLVMGDVAVTPVPDVDQLAQIAVCTARTAKAVAGFTDPRVAMLSFSTKGSAKHEVVDKVVAAVARAKEMDPNLKIDGDLQADAALVPAVGASKAPGSPIAGNANVLVVPSLEVGNISYKLVQRLGRAEAIGPILQGIARPVNDLSRGCSTDDVYKMIAVTANQAIAAKAQEK